jgi:hypothetical protein
MNCPDCKQDLNSCGIYKDIDGVIRGTVTILNASKFDSDDEGNEIWEDTYRIERDYSGPYQCYGCGAILEDEIVWAHFRGDNKATYEDNRTINMFL